jgi:hypothetical protein
MTATGVGRAVVRIIREGITVEEAISVYDPRGAHPGTHARGDQSYR